MPIARFNHFDPVARLFTIINNERLLFPTLVMIRDIIISSSSRTPGGRVGPRRAESCSDEKQHIPMANTYHGVNIIVIIINI